MTPERDDHRERRLSRLRDELRDENVPIPLGEGFGRRLVEEIDHARHPPVHEGHVPTYGCLLFDDARDDVETGPQDARRIEMHELPLDWARRFADGRGSFLVRDGDGKPWLAGFENSVEYEANLVRLVRGTGAHVVQRTAGGQVKIFTQSVVVVWDGTLWMQKPYAEGFEALVSRLVADCDQGVLAGILEVCVHWLSPALRGSIFVWSLHRPAADLDGLDLAGSMRQPRLDLMSPAEYSALSSLHAQLDRATLIEPDGTTSAYGVTLLPSTEAVDVVPPEKGTRHTSARRFSYDHPGTVLFVVSDDGPVSVYVDGARVALVQSDPSREVDDGRATTDEQDGFEERIVRCPSCERALVVDLPSSSRSGEQDLVCPVCGATAGSVAVKAEPRGVRTSEAERRSDEPDGRSDPGARKRTRGGSSPQLG